MASFDGSLIWRASRFSLVRFPGVAHSWTITETRKAGPSIKTVPEGDNRQRLVCPDCGYIEYSNPKVVVGALCVWEGKILLCKRAIEPRKGSWTVPAGFMELGETMIAGAIRETWEEARARIEVKRLAGIYEIPHIGHVHVFYQAVMTSPGYAPGPESEEVSLFAVEDIPWDQLAFQSVRWSLENLWEDDGPGVQFGYYAADAPPAGGSGG